jgi:D-alanyl-D-alanine carboxypeptidase
VPSQTSPDATALAGEVSTIRATLQTAVDARVFPGAVVVVRRGTRTRTVAVGRADVVTHSPMTAADRFRLASVTKSMVAAVALQLVADGRLSLSDTVDRWEPGLLAHGGDITVAELLGQTSGLPAFQSTRAFARLQGSPPPQKLVDMVAQAPLMFAPGSRSWYSNTNYLVLGMILQKVSHEPLAALLQHRLFDPLGLHSAGLAATRVNTPPLAHGYDHGRDVTFTAADLTWLWAAGGVVANAQDVARFYDALLSGRIVRGPLLQRMLEQRPETNHDLPFSGYGLGAPTLPTGCCQAYGHSGDAPGFMTHAWTTRNGKRSVVMIENTSLTVSVNDYIVSVLNEALCSP